MLRPSIPVLVVFGFLFAPLANALASGDPLDRLSPVPADQPVPALDFFRPPLFSAPKLSPDGRFFAAKVTIDGERRDLLVCDIDKGELGRIGGEANKDVYWFRWLTKNRILYKLSADKIYAQGVYVAAVPSVRAIFGYPVERYSVTDVFGVPRDKPMNPLIWVRRNAYDEGRNGGLFQIDASRSVMEDKWAIRGSRGDDANTSLKQYGVEASVVRSFPILKEGVPTAFWSDIDGNLAFGVATVDGQPRLYRFENGKWCRTAVDLDATDIVDVGDKPGELLVLEPGRNGAPRGLCRLDSATNALGEVILRDQQYDFDGGTVYRQPLTDRVVGAGLARSRWQCFWFDPKYAGIQKSVEAQFPRECVDIVGSDEKETRFLVAAWSDRKPAAYYLADLAKGTFGLVKSTRPWIDPDRMCPMSVIRYKARDGVEIEGYLTLPKGASKTSRAPLVVLPHGGPWVRDDWGWDGEVQFLASRGYAVFQPNYRGSTSFGWRVSNSDLWDFRKMHDDVTDGVAAMVRTGMVDPERIAIMGSSFGGYLAVCGAAFEPGLYRCSVTIAGVFDWERMIREVRTLDDNFARSERLLRKLGDPEACQARFDEISPLRHLDAVKIPVFVAHGRMDRVVDVDQSRRLVAELERRKIPCVSKFVRNEGHGLSFVDNRVELFQQIEEFLAKNLGAGN